MQPYRIKSITEYHRVTGLLKPEHPLVSLISIDMLKPQVSASSISLIFDFYIISLKRNLQVRQKYGQQYCDFDEGVLFFSAPGQVSTFEFEQETTKQPSGWMILVHPDLIWNTPLAKTIKQYQYFSYDVKEALYLSDKEERMITDIAHYIEQEYRSNIDKFSSSVIVAQLELLFTYAERFYQRQFLTRKVHSHQILDKVDSFLNEYFSGSQINKQGLPTVLQVAERLNLTAGYLSDLLKNLTGQTTQQHIHEKLIEKAKEKLSTTDLTISEIAYDLGFEHLQSFSKLFKAKTNLSPLEFRQSFN